MSAYFRLFKRFILRALLGERLRSLITVLGIALGVAVVIAVRLANASALDAFRTATESIAGETSVRIAGAAGRFDELLLRDLGWLRDYGQVSPVVEGYAKLEGAGDYLHVLGVDVLRDRNLRRYRLLQTAEGKNDPTAREFLLLLTDPDAIILTEKFARRHHLAIGARLPLIIGGGRREFMVRGLLADEGPARALDGNFALMDIAAAQWAFDRLGLLDHVDIKLREGLTLEEAEKGITARLPAALAVSRPASSLGQVEKMIAAFHFNLNALGSIALLVGLFLIYNTVSISVITRRDEIGVLRALGTGRTTVLALFLGEALLLALIGTVVGLIIGPLLASGAVRATATTVETFYIASAATESAAAHTLGVAEILLAFAVALPLSLVAAAVPALEASRVRPVEAMRGAERLARSFRPPPKYVAVALLLLAAGYWLSTLDAVGGLPVFGYLAALALMFGGAFLVPHALVLVCATGGRLIGALLRFLRVESKLASANLRGAVPRLSISVAALAVSLAMMAAITIMIESFRETVSYWVDQTLRADIFAKVITRTSSLSEGEITDQAVAAVKADPDALAVDSFRSRQVSYEGYPVTLGGGDFNVLLAHGQLSFKTPADARARLRDAIGRDEVAISESFSLHFNKQPGDTVELPVQAGMQAFKVVAVYYDYSNNRGTATMDRASYERHFPGARPASLSIYLRPGADVGQVRERFVNNLGGRFQLVFTTNAEIRREVIRIFNSTFVITYALEVIAILVAGLGVISTLIALILERRGELAILSFIGATRAQIRRMVVVESLMLGGVSQLVGVLIGALLSLVLIYVINVQSFGWTIRFHLPVVFIAQSTLLILAVTALAGLYPASRAAALASVEALREE